MEEKKILHINSNIVSAEFSVLKREGGIPNVCHKLNDVSDVACFGVGIVERFNQPNRVPASDNLA
jgi:hypothetical protein